MGLLHVNAVRPDRQHVAEERGRLHLDIPHSTPRGPRSLLHRVPELEHLPSVIDMPPVLISPVRRLISGVLPECRRLARVDAPLALGLLPIPRRGVRVEPAGRRQDTTTRAGLPRRDPCSKSHTDSTVAGRKGPVENPLAAETARNPVSSRTRSC